MPLDSGHSADGRAVTALGVSTWLWTSPLDDDHLAELAAADRRLGLRPDRAAHRAGRRLGPGARRRRAGAARSRRDDLCGDDAASATSRPATRPTTAATQAYLRACVDAAARVGSPVVAGPMYAPVGQVWRLDEAERAATVERLADGAASGRRLRRDARRAARARAPEPLRDQPRQHRRPGHGDHRGRRLARARHLPRHVPPEHRGEGPRGRDPAGRSPDRARPGLRDGSRHAGSRPLRLAGLRRGARRRRLRRARVHRVVHDRQRVDRPGGVDLAPAGADPGPAGDRRPRVPARRIRRETSTTEDRRA